MLELKDSAIASALINQRRREGRRWRLLMLLGAVLLISFTFDIVTGPSLLPPSNVVEVLLNFLGLDIRIDESTRIIVMELRLPIALMAVVVGGALGVGGAEVQTLLNNPMASPYTLGMAAAAGFGAALVLFFDGLGLDPNYAVPLGAFLFCMLSSFILFGLALINNIGQQHLILAGIALLFLFQSLLSLIQVISSPELSQQILFWLFGSLSKATWQNFFITLTITGMCLAILIQDAWKLTALRLGEARARSLGINVVRLRLKTLIVVTIMTATATSFVGIIGFIGLVAPNIARMLIGEDQRFFLPLSFLCGATLLSCASILSKTLVPGALFPVGIVTAIIGVPFFFWLIVFRRNRRA